MVYHDTWKSLNVDRLTHECGQGRIECERDESGKLDCRGVAESCMHTMGKGTFTRGTVVRVEATRARFSKRERISVFVGLVWLLVWISQA